MNEARSNSSPSGGGPPTGAVCGAREKRPWHSPIITTLDAQGRTESGTQNPYPHESSNYYPQS